MWKYLVALLAVVGRVGAHVYLAEPPARNVVTNYEYCKQCLNGPGFCGDREGSRDNEAPGRVVARLSGTVRARMVIEANHKGRWGLQLCGASSGKRRALLRHRHRPHKCRRRRADGSCRKRPRHESADPDPVGRSDAGRDDTEASPRDCVSLRTTGGDKYVYLRGAESESSATWRLPPGKSCAACVLRLVYETGNSCDPPGTPPEFAGQGFLDCAQYAWWEKFTNCADVAVS